MSLTALFFKIVLNVTQPNVQSAKKGLSKSLIQNNVCSQQRIVLWVARYALKINVSNARGDIHLNHGQSALTARSCLAETQRGSAKLCNQIVQVLQTANRVFKMNV